MKNRLKKFILLLPVVILITVFCAQIYNKNTVHLSNWRGGGFGMYSAFHPSNRFIRVSFILPDKETFSFTSYKGEWGVIGFRTKILPSLSNFNELRLKIKELQWVYSNYERNQISVTELGKPVNPNLILKPDSLKLDLYEPVLTGKGLVLEKKMIASHIYTWSNE